MSKKEKWMNAAVSVLLAAAVVLCITVIAQTLSKGYITFFGHSLFRVVTGSMEPTIPVDALLITEEVDIEKIKEGDIVCFRSMETNMLGQVITHRVVKVIERENGDIYLETKGDANPSADGHYVTEKNLIGKVSTYTKEGNIIAAVYAAITTPFGFLAFVVFPILLVAGFIMKGSVSSIQEELNTLSQGNGEMKEDSPISPEEYQEMVERLRNEILEEVRQSVEKAGEKQ